MEQYAVNLMGKAFLISLIITVLLGPVAIPVLTRLKFGQNIRNEGPSRHMKKAGTPTMGGIIFLIGIVLSTLWLTKDKEAIIIAVAFLGFGLIGLLDDFIKVVLKRSLGLRAREKLFGQVFLAGLVASAALTYLGRDTSVSIPFSNIFSTGVVHLHFGYLLYILFSILVIVGAANAVNLTDGLDGLAAGVTTAVAAAYAIIGILSAQPGVSIVMASVVGGCLGFLFYNRYPARIFMGDTGSLALGGGLGAVSIITESELFLVVIGGIYVIEALSVMIQVFSFKFFRRRVFRMSPLHHHFELLGWGENIIVFSFWIVSVFLALIGLYSYQGMV
ncbi:MAG: phospho-N-acetylmuramoyl-pentapeptide-transferase [Clostridiales bacterium]|nr:phospho-N-acetylmuramoyl-pentapeptide-transferase [Clostridiales bacterium]MCF8021364.1 phospho-N-acetylmuramoyl-pentapeptide-transferase [Clostridiales bacterium]